jgi:hypothetical protein
MCAVDIGVGHDDDLAITRLQTEHVFADARANGGNDGADFLVRENLVEASARR